MGSPDDWRADAARNAALWTQSNAEYTDANAEVNWSLDEISWGIWGIDESELNVLGDVADLVVSEYGASIWVDPYRWIPEAARLLRPGGRLVFLRNSTLVILCSDDEEPAKDYLVHAQFGMKRFEWPDGGVEFHLAHGEWIDLLRANGFEIERLVEIQAPADAVTHEQYAYVTADWARKWPCEEIWAARKSLR